MVANEFYLEYDLQQAENTLWRATPPPINTRP